jgi:hypothetical protein
MSTIVRDPSTGKGMTVNDEGRAEVNAIRIPKIAATSENHGEAYTWTAISADIDTGDTALYVVNNSTTKKLHITKIYVWADTAVQFKIHVPAYVTPAGGSEVVGVNLNRDSGNAAEATARADETACVFAAANVITTIRNNEVGSDQFGEWVDYEGALILGYHDSVAVDLIGETAAFECTIMGYFHT